MQEVPKIVLDRMRNQTGAQKIAASHPDANVLTAFAEQLLPENERVVVVEHLARCGECREVVELALPEMEAIAAPLASGSRAASWLTWPVLRWGFVAAGVAIVSVGILRYQRKTEMAMMLSQKPAASTTMTQSPAMSTALPADAMNGARERDKAKDSASKEEARLETFETPTEKKAETRLVAPKAEEHFNGANQVTLAAPPPTVRMPRPTMGGVIGGPLPGGPRMPMQWQQQQAQQQPAQQQAAQQQQAQQAAQQPAIGGVAGGVARVYAPPASAPVPPATSGAEAGAAKIPPSSQMVAVQPQGTAEARGANTIEVNGANEQVETAQVEVQSAAPAVAGDDLRVGKAKPADTVEVPAAPTEITDSSGTPQPKYARNVRVAPLVPRWTVSAAGGLQRSFDQGNTWEAVDVNPGYSGRDFTGMLGLVPAQRAAGKAGSSPTNNSQPSGGPSNASQANNSNANNANANNANATNANAANTNISNLDASNANVAGYEAKAKQNAAATVFRAVVATGSEVWAGGSSGALFHSYDAGNHWSRVVPVSAGIPLTSDIVSIEFSDAQHGRITTSAAEIWTTADDGQTWQRQ